MAENYELDLTDGEFASLIGYEKKVLKDAKNFTGALLPDITRSVDWVFLQCDLITRAANNVESDVLYSLSIIGRQVSYPFNEEPYRLEWHWRSKKARQKRQKKRQKKLQKGRLRKRRKTLVKRWWKRGLTKFSNYCEKDGQKQRLARHRQKAKKCRKMMQC